MRKSTYIIGGALFLLALGVLALSGCASQSRPDVIMYDFIYASGYSKDPYTRETVQPVIGTDLQLAVSQSEKEALQFLDAQGGLLYSLTDFKTEAAQKGSLTQTVRSEAAQKVVMLAGGLYLPYNEKTGEGVIWLCSEAWAKSAYNGYIDNTLRGGRIMLLNGQNGQVLFSMDTEPGELFLTARGSRCYFYYPGKSSRRKADSVPAQIYWRDVNFWLLPHTVCSFDYIGAPEIEGREIERLRFYPQADAEGKYLRVDFTCYEQTNAENDRWDYVVQYSLDVPLTLEPAQDEEDTE